MKKLLVALALLVFAAPISAEVLGKGSISASQPTCKASRNQRLYLIDDGQPATPYLSICRDTTGSGSWNWVNVGGLSGSVLLAGDADGQDIYGFSGNVANAHFTLGENTLAGTALTSIGFTTPKFFVSGLHEYKATNVTTADDAAGTKPAIVIPITSDVATCTCNDATGCAASIAEPTPTATYSHMLTIVSIGTGTCEFTTSAGVLEVGDTPIALKPKDVLSLVYVNSAWYSSGTKVNSAVE